MRGTSLFFAALYSIPAVPSSSDLAALLHPAPPTPYTHATTYTPRWLCCTYVRVQQHRRTDGRKSLGLRAGV